MIFILNSKQVGKNKKLTKKMVKILVSDVFEKEDKDKNIIEMPVLLPPPKLFCKLIEKDISAKKFKKKYITNILEDPDKLSLIVCIAVIAIRNKNIILTCSKQEMEYEYLEAIATILKERYGFKISDKISKDNISKKVKYSSKMLLQDFYDTSSLIVSSKKEYKEIVNAITGKESKKSNSFKKKKNKEKEYLDIYSNDEDNDVYDDVKMYEKSVTVYRKIKVLLDKKE